MEIWLRDPWALFSRRAGVVYAACILLILAGYAYSNRLAPVAGTVSFVVFISVLAAFLLLAGTSQLTWTDPANALALLLISLALLLDGVFVAGAPTFGPVRVLDVGVLEWPNDRDDTYFWLDGQWLRTKLTHRMSEGEYRNFQAWSGNLALTNRLDLKPGRIQISMWDRQVYRIEMKNRRPPMTIGEAPHARPRMFVELFCGLILLGCAAWVRREGRRRGISYRRRDTLLDGF